MNAKSVVKNRVLTKKIAEYFQKFPEKSSVVVKADLGDQQVFWKAVREGVDSFRVCEVKTTTENYAIKADTMSEAISPTFADISRTFLNVTSKPFQPSDIANAKRVIRTKSLQLTTPEEQQMATAIMSNLDTIAGSPRSSSNVAKSGTSQVKMAGENKKKKIVTGAPPKAKLTKEADDNVKKKSKKIPMKKGQKTKKMMMTAKNCLPSKAP